MIRDLKVRISMTQDVTGSEDGHDTVRISMIQNLEVKITMVQDKAKFHRLRLP